MRMKVFFFAFAHVFDLAKEKIFFGQENVD